MDKTVFDRLELIDKDYLPFLRALPPYQRVAQASDLVRFIRTTMTTHLRSRHPDWSDDQITAEAARRLLRGTR